MQQAGPSSRRPFWPVPVAAAYDAMGYVVVGPVLPAIRDRIGASSLEASAIFAAFALGMLLGFALSGVAARRRGPRLVLVSGVVLHLVADVLFATAGTVSAYTVARLLQGVGSGGLWVGAVLMALAWWPESPARRFGTILSAYAAGSVAGSLLAGLGGTVRPFVADGTIAVAALGACLLLPGGRGRALGWSAGALRDPRFLFASAVVLFSAFFYSTLEGSLTLLFSERLDQTGLAGLVALTTLAGGAGALAPVPAGRGEGRLPVSVGVSGCALLVLAALATATAQGWFLLLPAAALALGASETRAFAILALVPEEGLITAMVGNAYAWGVGFLIAPPLATWLAEMAGRWGAAAGLAAAAVLVVALGLTAARRGERATAASTR